MLLAQDLAPYYCSSFGGTKKQETFSDFLLLISSLMTNHSISTISVIVAHLVNGK